MGFVSLFVVIPYLTSDKVLYGIYSVCTSLIIFLSYADLGFLGSGAKYAAEYYIKGDHENEVKVIGFTAFFMMMAFLLIDVIFFLFALKPDLLMPEIIEGTKQYVTAQRLLFILVAGCPIIISQRILQIVYTIRVEDYKFERLSIAGNSLKILSVFFFFSDGNYPIVEYYAFYHLVNAIVAISALVYTKNYGYRFTDLCKSFKFDKGIFDKEKSLSLASFAFMLSMMAYNEFDQIAISKLFGLESVALYATAFSIMTFVRTYSGLVYSPFTSRYNHFIGMNDKRGLVAFTEKIIVFFSPILVVPILCVSLFSKPFIISWLGENYESASVLISWMVMSYSLNCVTQPLNCYMIASEKNSKLLTGAVLLPLIYWIGILFTSNHMGVCSFSMMKFIAPLVLLFYYWCIVTQDIKDNGYSFVRLFKIVVLLLPSVLVAIILSLIIKPNMYYEFSKLSLIRNMLVMVIVVAISLSVSLLFNKELRMFVFSGIGFIKHYKI